MVKNYLRVAFRSILKHKGYSFINISGLAMGMAICILILLWVQDELSFDRFHKNSNEIYRVVEDQIASNGEIFRVAPTPWPLGAAFTKDYPEVINFTRFHRIDPKLIKSGDKPFYEKDICVADPSFLEIFTFPLLKGDPATALSKPNTCLITEKMAEKYFGSKNPIGKTITFNNKDDFFITGVLKNVPHNSHLKFDFLLPFEPTLKKLKYRDDWHTNNYYTFILLQKNAAVENLGEKYGNIFMGKLHHV